MSGTPSRVDCGLLQEMQQRGLKPACVRTHFDQVKQQEENAEQTMQADRTRLADYGVEQCYFVSNLRESPYYENLTPLQTMLTECGSNAQEELENAIRMRLYVLAERCEKSWNSGSRCSESWTRRISRPCRKSVRSSARRLKHWSRVRRRARKRS